MPSSYAASTKTPHVYSRGPELGTGQLAVTREGVDSLRLEKMGTSDPRGGSPRPRRQGGGSVRGCPARATKVLGEEQVPRQRVQVFDFI